MPEFYGEETAERLVPAGASAVVDAMDTVVAKLHVIARCREQRRSSLVTALGAACRLDPTAVQVTDLCESHTDQLAKDVRKYLRRRYGIPATEPTGVLAVWSVEEPRETLALPGDEDGLPGVALAPGRGAAPRTPLLRQRRLRHRRLRPGRGRGGGLARLTGVVPRTQRVLAEAERSAPEEAPARPPEPHHSRCSAGNAPTSAR